MPTVKVINEAI